MNRVLLFAGLNEAVHASQITLPPDAAATTVGDIRHWLAEQYPQIEDLLQKSMAAVNQEYAHDDTRVSTTDEIAFIPPVSGG